MFGRRESNPHHLDTRFVGGMRRYLLAASGFAAQMKVRPVALDARDASVTPPPVSHEDGQALLRCDPICLWQILLQKSVEGHVRG
jgi:hypothetical protein